MDNFIIHKGFNGDITDVDEKVKFIKDKFQEAAVFPIPRNVKKWFTEKKRIEKRKIAFQICFAFELNLQECENFFRTVCMQRGFDIENDFCNKFVFIFRSNVVINAKFI